MVTNDTNSNFPKLPTPEWKRGLVSCCFQFHCHKWIHYLWLHSNKDDDDDDAAPAADDDTDTLDNNHIEDTLMPSDQM